MKLPKPKKIKRSTIKKKAWHEFSIYIRRKYVNRLGEVSCYTCGKWDVWKKLQCGHGIGGRNNAILFDERAVRPQCVGCNVFGRGQYRRFTRKLIAELGLEGYDTLVKQSNRTVQFKVSDLEVIYKKYKKLNEKYE